MNESTTLSREFNAVCSEAGKPLFVDPHETSVFDFVNDFHANFVKEWGDEPPSLSEIADGMVENIIQHADSDLNEEEQKLAEAVKKIAERAQYNISRKRINEYHNIPHSAHVAIVKFFMTKDMPIKDRLLGIAVAFGHDIDHPGTTNNPDDPFEHEQRSWDVMKEIMSECGVNPDDIETARLMQLSTSINGGSLYGKLVAEALHIGRDVNHEAIKEGIWSRLKEKPVEDAADKLIEEEKLDAGEKGSYIAEKKEGFMKALDKMEPLSEAKKDDSRLIHSTVLPVADTFPSLIMPELSAAKLTEEHQAFGSTMDFNPAGSRAYFIDRVIGRCAFEIIGPLKKFLPVYNHFKDRSDNYSLGVDAPKHFLERYLGIDIAA